MLADGSRVRGGRIGHQVMSVPMAW
jgi:hypothetical protein